MKLRLSGHPDGSYTVLALEDGSWQPIGKIWRCSPSRWTTSCGGKGPTRKWAKIHVGEEHDKEPEETTRQEPGSKFWGTDQEVHCDPALDDFTVDPAYADGRGALPNHVSRASR